MPADDQPERPWIGPVVMLVVLTVLAGCVPVVVMLVQGVTMGRDCGPKKASAVRTDPAALPAAVRDLTVREAAFVDYRWCFELGAEGFAVMDPVEAQWLRDHHSWRATTLDLLHDTLSAHLPPGAAWLESADWASEYGRSGWRTMLLDVHSDTVYFRDAYDLD